MHLGSNEFVFLEVLLFACEVLVAEVFPFTVGEG